MPDIGKFYERVKHEYIYPKYFSQSVAMEEDGFRKAVAKAYRDIIMLIPDLRGTGNSDEDYYMAEWLKLHRCSYTASSNHTIEEVAYMIYQIREKEGI